MPADPQTLPERIRYARGLAGLSARRVAILAGRHPQWLTAVERGVNRAPSAVALSAVARVLGVTVEWLLEGTGGGPTVGSVQAASEEADAALASTEGPEAA